MKKLEIGQYWHRLEDGMEWIVCKEIAGDYFSCECTKQATIWVISEVGHWNYEELIECGYVLGRHPDNVEHKAEWQPKEGELVWILDHKPSTNYFTPCKGQVIRSVDDGDIWIGYKNKSRQLVCRYLKNITIEPYADQDKKIDFSVAGQWVKCGDNIVKVILNEDSHCFWGEYLGGVNSHKFSKDLTWQILTPEQINPILDAIKALTESQND